MLIGLVDEGFQASPGACIRQQACIPLFHAYSLLLQAVWFSPEEPDTLVEPEQVRLLAHH